MIVRFIAALIVVGAMGMARGSAATVRPLELPGGLTVSPEADRRLMSIGADGTVYAIASRPDGSGHLRALRWRAGSSTPEVFSPLEQPPDRGEKSEADVDAVAPVKGGAYVTLGRTHGGTYIGTQFDVDRWVDAEAKAWTPPTCTGVKYYSTHVYAADGNRIALTIDPSSNAVFIDLDEPTMVQENLPRALLLESGRCKSLGAAIVTGLRGASVVGYIGYINAKPAPWFVNLMDQRLVALVWRDGNEAQLGPGVPFATSSSGVAVGASALPGHAGESVTGSFSGTPFTDRFPTPHAVLWPRDGRRMNLVHGDSRSAAWDIDERGTVVGVTESVDGRHYAFRFAGRRVERLDDLPHPPGWRFESAYAIGSDGAVAGIGRYRGIPTAYVWRPS